MRYLFTGGGGLLGSKLKKHFPNALFPTSHEFDYTNEVDIDSLRFSKDFDVLVHLGAYTDTVGIESNIEKAISNNVVGTANLVGLCSELNKKMIYMSTDYVFDGEEGGYTEDSPTNPPNKYGLSKLAGECAVRMYDNSLVIRGSFCADKFPYPKAFEDQHTSRMGVTKFAECFAYIIKTDTKGIVHVTNGRKSVYELAKELSPDKEINPISINDIEGYPLPKDTSLRSLRVLGETKWQM